MEIKQLHRKIDKLLGESKPKWVTAKWVQMLTGWNGEDLRQAREQEVIEWKKEEDGIKYNVYSIPKPFIKSWTTENTKN
jgi:hypothetical protein